MPSRPCGRKSVSEPQTDLQDLIRRYEHAPLLMVREMFHANPDAWQTQALELLPKSPRLALVSCTGPGKTAFLAWAAWWWLFTRWCPRIWALSISSENLRDNLWAEMAKWRHESKILEGMFTFSAESIRIKDGDYANDWYMTARSWSKTADKNQQALALKGLHAEFPMIIMDESGGIPEAVSATAEAIFSSCTEAHFLQAGNPTNLSGPLHNACTRDRALWEVIHITGDPDDPKRSSRVSVEWARQEIKKYGPDNPWVLVNVFGKFPPASINSLISADECNAALGKHLRKPDYEWAAKILGVDVGRYGDDATVIYPRQGLASFIPIILRNMDSSQVAGHITRKYNDMLGDAIMVDDTGGFGSGVRDRLRDLHYDNMGVVFSGKPTDPQYYNKRAEIWWKTCDWIRAGGALPPCATHVVEELTTANYSFKGDRIIIEEKDQMKIRLGRSPDETDALACTFAFDVAPQVRTLEAVQVALNAMSQQTHSYDPWERYRKEMEREHG